MTVAWDEQPNRIGSALFVTSLVLLVFGMGGALAGFVRLYASSPRGRRFAYAAAVAGALDCACFIGVALTPENQAMTLHVAFTLAAFRVLPVATLLIMLAARATPAMPRRIVAVWGALALVLFAYAASLQGGAWAATATGFVAQVVAQKVVAIVMVSAVAWQSHVAMRTLAPPTPVAGSSPLM